MTQEELKRKYVDTLVMGVDAKIILPLLTDGFNPPDEAIADTIQCNLKSMLRCEAEQNPAFKQIIPYIIMMGMDGRIFITLRLGGDERLKGQHSIGLGGHMDGGEDVLTALYRELKEEVGLTEADVRDIRLSGYIYSGKTEVDSVHVGAVYLLKAEHSEVSCLERDTLFGYWCNAVE